MTPKQKVIAGISAAIILAGAAYLIYEHTKKPVPKAPSEPDKKSDSPTVVAPVTPAGKPEVKGVYANRDGVNVYSIYDSKVLKIVDKDGWIGTYAGDKSKDSIYVNTSSGKAFVVKLLVTIK